MTKNNINDFKVGDKVTFGCYGYHDIEEPYTIVEIKETLPMLGRYEYIIENSKGNRLLAYIDEIIPLKK